MPRTLSPPRTGRRMARKPYVHETPFRPDGTGVHRAEESNDVQQHPVLAVPATRAGASEQDRGVSDGPVLGGCAGTRD
ncbi:MAG: hypothetical protein ACK559_16415 [bacterium]